jgi:hypothetical protein
MNVMYLAGNRGTSSSYLNCRMSGANPSWCSIKGIIMKIMSKNDMQARIRNIKEELENRYKYGTIKLADADGKPISTEALQNELFSLIYKLSKRD